MPGRSSLQRGFTLIELLVVIVVLSLCAATTVRWYFSHPEVTLDNAAMLLARDLRAAQHRSIFLGEPGRLVFLPDGEGYTLTDAAGVIVHNPHTDEPFLRAYSQDGVFMGVRVVDAHAGEDRTLEIDGRGNPLEDLAVTLDFDGEQRTVLLDHESAGITIVGSARDLAELDL